MKTKLLSLLLALLLAICLCSSTAVVFAEEVSVPEEEHVHAFGEWVQNPEEETHMRECDCGEVEKGDCEWAVENFSAESEENITVDFVCSVCGTKKQISGALSDFIESVEPNVTLPEGSTAVIDPEAQILVQKMKEGLSDSIMQNIKTQVGELLNVIGLYNVTMLVNGEVTQPNGEVLVTLPTGEEVKGYLLVEVVFIDESGSVSICPTTLGEEGTSFKTSKFGFFAIVGVPIPPVIQQACSMSLSSTLPSLITFLSAVSAGVIIVRKRKEN